MHFAIIGTGFITPLHMEAIHHVGGRVSGVYNTLRGEADWREAIDDPAADAVVILTPNHLHVPMALAASDRGKRVLCEKPLGISSEEVARLAGRDVRTVLQLRHHPLVSDLRDIAASGERAEIAMDITVFRDAPYFASWKGDDARSGGILFNIGIHYFDLLLHVFGEPTVRDVWESTPRAAAGLIVGPRYRCRWRVRIDPDRKRQRRLFRVNGVDYDFSVKDNLSAENLHRAVYREFVGGGGVLPEDALPSVKLVEALKKEPSVPK